MSVGLCEGLNVIEERGEKANRGREKENHGAFIYTFTPLIELAEQAVCVVVIIVIIITNMGIDGCQAA
jgi:hypothetical protein